MNILENLSFNRNKVTSLQVPVGRHKHVTAIGLTRDQELKEHISHVPATLIVLQGKVDFAMKGHVKQLSACDVLEIPVNEMHAVKGLEDENAILIVKGESG